MVTITLPSLLLKNIPLNKIDPGKRSYAPLSLEPVRAIEKMKTNPMKK
jgi:hypothetical protein